MGGGLFRMEKGIRKKFWLFEFFLQKSVDKGFLICYNSNCSAKATAAAGKNKMQMWRNWQTRYFEVVVSFLVWVQVPSSAPYADMAELADALDSGSSECKFMQVQVLLSAPYGRVPEWPKGADCKSVA